MYLKNKTIVVISSEAWGKIFISKHNYAIALARRGNRVFFLNPIDLSLRRGEIKVEESGIHSDLKIVSYRPFFPFLLKFHFRKAFEVLIRWNIRKVLDTLKIRPDIVWDFNWSYLYEDLSIFRAPLRIFNPVDKLSEDTRHKKADLVISISDEILEQYLRNDVPRLRLNHGLGGPFALAAEKAPVGRSDKNIRVGYVGNLTLDSLDKDLMLGLIQQNPDVSFDLVGPVSGKDHNLGSRTGEDVAAVFAEALQQQKNVTLRGTMAQHEVPAFMESCDILLLCYRRTPSFRCDNSHKMMEYLSSGKVVVCTNLSAYKGSDLVEMSPVDDNGLLPSIFRRVVEDIDKYNAPAMQARRKAYALQNTYDNHIGTIESFIQANIQKA